MRAARDYTASAPALVAEEPGLLRATWSLAWPVIFSFSIESLVGICDLLMVGRLGPASVAAVGVGVQILSAVNAMMFAVGTGTLAVVARQIGAGERREAEETLLQSVLAAFVLSALAVLPVLLWPGPLLRFFRVDPEVVAIGVRFVRVIMLAVPSGAVVFVISASLRGAGDTRTPLAVGATVGVLNVAAAYVLIFGHLGLPPLGVVGAATATTSAYATGALLGVGLVTGLPLVLRLRWRGLRVRLDVMRRVLRIGYPAALEHLLMQLGFFLYIIFAARYGTGAVAAYFIGARILALSFLPGLGFAVAAGAMVGQALGAGEARDAERSGWAALRLASYLMTAAGVVIFLAARPIARLFVADPAVVTEAVGFIRVLAVAQPLMAVDFVVGGALRGAGDTRFPLVAVFLGFYLCRLGAASLVTFAFHLPLIWLWLAVIGDYVARAALKAWRFHSGRWKHVRV